MKQPQSRQSVGGRSHKILLLLLEERKTWRGLVNLEIFTTTINFGMLIIIFIIIYYVCSLPVWLGTLLVTEF